MAKVRLPLLTPQFLSDRVASEELVKSDHKCRYALVIVWTHCGIIIQLQFALFCMLLIRCNKNMNKFSFAHLVFGFVINDFWPEKSMQKSKVQYKLGYILLNAQQDHFTWIKSKRFQVVQKKILNDKINGRVANSWQNSGIFSRDLLDVARDYHLMPERRHLLQTFKARPRCCSDIPGMIYAVGGLTSSGLF